MRHLAASRIGVPVAPGQRDPLFVTPPVKLAFHRVRLTDVGALLTEDQLDRETRTRVDAPLPDMCCMNRWSMFRVPPMYVVPSEQRWMYTNADMA